MTSPCVEAAVEELEQVGITPEVSNTSKHIAVRWSVGGQQRVVHVSASPSDFRAPMRAKSDVRRLLREDGIGAAEDTAEQPDSPRIFLRDGKFFCDSRDIAKHFNKQHKDVLRAIDKSLPNLGDFTERNFTLSEYTDPTGRKLRCFNLTRDGFSFLAMGFTGRKADEWKVRYLTAFNAMEAELAKVPADDSLPGRVSKLEGELQALIDLCFTLPQPEPGYTVVRAYKRKNPKRKLTPRASTQVGAAPCLQQFA